MIERKKDIITKTIYATDSGIYKVLPKEVVYPENEDDVKDIIMYAKKKGIPIIPRGTGSSATASPIGDGIIIDFTKYYNRIINIDYEKQYIEVEPGITYGEINEELIKRGYRLYPDPSSGDYITIGGMIANNSSGPHSLLYGDMLNNTLSLKVIIPSLEIIQEENQKEFLYPLISYLQTYEKEIFSSFSGFKKNSSGYLLNKLLIRKDIPSIIAASEGTLAIILSSRLKIHKIHKYSYLILVNVYKLEDIASVVLLSYQYSPSAIELNSKELIKIAKKYLNLPKSDNIEAEIFVEISSDDEEDCKQRAKKLIDKLKKDIYDIDISVAYTTEEKEKLWSVRRSAIPLLDSRDSDFKVIPLFEDGAVDIKLLGEYIKKMRQLILSHKIPYTMLGHAGEGNLHIRPLMNLKKEKYKKKLNSLLQGFLEIIKELKGTISGEHGDGLLRAKLVKSLFKDIYPLFIYTKKFFDKTYILNPGKIIYDEKVSQNFKIKYQDKTIKYTPTFFQSTKDIVRMAEKCQGCSKCKSLIENNRMCPAYKIYRNEAHSPKSRANLFREYLYGNISEKDFFSKKSMEVFSSCMLCKQCLIECPSKVDIPSLVMEYRNKLLERNITYFLQNMYFIKSKDTIKMIAKTPKIIKKIFIENDILKEIISYISSISIVGLDISKDIKDLKEILILPKERAKNIYYIPDLGIRYTAPNFGIISLSFLYANGYKANVLWDVFTEYPSLVYGDKDRFLKAIKRLYNIYKENKEAIFIIGEPTPLLAIKHNAKKLVSDEYNAEFFEKFFGLFDILLQSENFDIKREKLLEIRKRILYHIPCHGRFLYKEKKIYPAIDYLRKLGFIVEELKIPCCGLSGSFGFRQKNEEKFLISAERIMKKIQKYRYDYLATDCSSCYQALSYITKQKVYHPLEIVLKNMLSYKLDMIEGNTLWQNM